MSATGTAILRITDGTTSVDLRDTGVGFWLKEWLPEIAIGKNDGVWLDSPIAPGRRMVYRQLGNAVETFTLAVAGGTQDMTIRKLQKLFNLLEQAVEYWTSDAQTNFVWIEAKSREETNARYALVCNWRLTGVNDPFAQPFETSVANLAAMDELTLVIERQHWLENEPGTGTLTKISAVESYNGRNFGNVDEDGDRQPTSAAEVYIANHRSVANLTHVFRYDSSAGTYSGNLLDETLPYALLPDPPAVDDCIYFGIDDSISDSGAFSSLVFDIMTAGIGYAGQWEYFDFTNSTPSWEPLSKLYPIDNTNQNGAETGIAFDTMGVNSVHWFPIYECEIIGGTTWSSTAVNGVNGMWVRYRVTSGGTSAPIQQNRNPYTITWPYIEIAADEIGGDIDALLKLSFYNESCYGGPCDYPDKRPCSKIFMGSRKMSRGEDFTAYINLSNEQNPSNISVTLGSDASFEDETSTCNRYIPGDYSVKIDGNATTTVTVTIGAPLANDYIGTYHLFLRGNQPAEATTTRISATVYIMSYQELRTSVLRTELEHFWPNIVDLGIVTIPEIGPLDSITFEINVETTDYHSINLHDLILLPIDELSIELYQADPQVDGWVADQLHLGRKDLSGIESIHAVADNISYPRHGIQALLKDTANNTVIGFWTIISNHEFAVCPNERVRFWFLLLQRYGYDPTYYSHYADPTVAGIITIETVQRYLTMRGKQ